MEFIEVNESGECLFRYHNYQDRLELEKHYIKKETECGYWLKYFTKKWVSKTGRKRFAYPTKKEALNSFIARKERQIGILRSQLKNAEHTLKKAKDF